MNILFLSTRLPYPPKNGHFQRTYNVIRHLSRIHNVYLIAFYSKGLTKQQKQEYLTEMEKVCSECHAFSIPAEYSRIPLAGLFLKSFISRKPLIAHKYSLRVADNCIRKILERVAIDFVHYDLLPLAEYRDNLKNLPDLMTEHNVEYLRYSRWIDKERNPITRYYINSQHKKLKAYELDTVASFGKCVVVSEYDKSVLQHQAPNTDFCVVPNGTDEEYFKPMAVDMKPNTLVWVGGMSQWPNRDAIKYFVQEIFPLICNHVPDSIFHLIGKDPVPALKATPLKKKIKVHGFVDDARPIVGFSLVYVAPIRIGSGTKLKILDAMAMGKCVVTTSIGIEGIEADHGKEVFICNTPRDFANTIITLFGDIELVRHIGENARKVILEKYAWSTIFNKMDKLYEGGSKN